MTDEETTLRPDLEAAVHVIRAGRELLGAAKSVIEGLDAYLAILEERVAAPKKAPPTIQAIPIRRESG
jgi:hypothetical protein